MVILMPISVSQRWRQVHNSIHIKGILRLISSMEIIEFVQNIIDHKYGEKKSDESIRH